MLELRVAGWHEGDALARLGRELLPLSASGGDLLFVADDDLTDEDSFVAAMELERERGAASLQALTVLVAPLEEPERGGGGGAGGVGGAGVGFSGDRGHVASARATAAREAVRGTDELVEALECVCVALGV